MKTPDQRRGESGPTLGVAELARPPLALRAVGIADDLPLLRLVDDLPLLIDVHPRRVAEVLADQFGVDLRVARDEGFADFSQAAALGLQGTRIAVDGRL